MPRHLGLLVLVLALSLLPARGAARQVIPAASPTAASGIAVQTLATVLLPEGSWPREGSLVDWVELTFKPGFAVDLASGQFPAGVRLVYVVSGIYTTRVDGPLTVLRREQEDVVPAGTEVTLAPGEAAFYPDNSMAQSFGNPGDEPLVIWFAAVGGDIPPPPEAGITKTQRGFVWAHEMDGPYAPPAGDLMMTWQQWTLHPGAALTDHEAVGTELIYIQQGAIQVRYDRSPVASQATPGAGRTNLAGDSTRIAPGSVATIANAAQEPTTLIVLSIAPAGGLTGTPSP